MRWTELTEEKKQKNGEDSSPMVTEKDDDRTGSSNEAVSNDRWRTDSNRPQNGQTETPQHQEATYAPAASTYESPTTTSLPDDMASTLTALAQVSSQPIAYSAEFSAAHPSTEFSVEDDELIFQYRQDGATWTVLLHTTRTGC